MSWDYYRSVGYTPVTTKYREISNASTATKIVLWTPNASMRIALTALSISCNPGGTIAFFFGGDNNALKISQYTVTGSSTIYPEIEGIESTATDAPLYCNVSTGITNAWTVMADGFEID